MSVQQRGPVQRRLQRCPFCHESVEPERSDEWVACSRCLARHHEPCWGEGGACAACGHERALSPRQALEEGDEVGAPVPAEEEDALDAARRETAQLLEGEGRRGTWLGAVAGSAVTLGVLPIVRGELELHRHRRRNREEAGPLPPLSDKWRSQVERARAAAFGDGLPGAAVARASLLGPFTLGAFVAAVATSAHALDHMPFHNHWDEAFLAQCFLTAATFLHVHLFREAVAGHESRQAFAALVSSAVPADPTREVLARTGRDWNVRRAIDVTLTLASLVPGLGILVCLLAATRQRSALALHEEHEELLEGACRRSGAIGMAGKDASATADEAGEGAA